MLVRGFRYKVAMPIWRMSATTCLRPTGKPSVCSRSRRRRLPRNGHFRCSSSMRRISIKSASETESVLSPRIVANATLALNAAEWFLLDRFIVSAPVKNIFFGSSSTTYRPVQFAGASSPLQVSGSIVGQRELGEIVYLKKNQVAGEQYFEPGSPELRVVVVIIVLLMCGALVVIPWLILGKTMTNVKSKASLVISWVFIGVLWLAVGFVVWRV